MKKAFTAKYTAKFPDLYFKSLFNGDTAQLDMSQDGHAAITREMKKYLEWLPTNDIFKVDFIAAYQTMKAKHPQITMEQCLSWYSRYGNILFDESFYNQASLKEQTKSVTNYRIVILDATEDFMQNDFLKFSNREWAQIDITGRHFDNNFWTCLKNQAAANEYDQKYEQSKTKFAKYQLSALAFVDQDNRYFFAMPVFMHNVNEYYDNCAIPSYIPRETVTIQQMNDILAHFDLLQTENHIYLNQLIHSIDSSTNFSYVNIFYHWLSYQAFIDLVEANTDQDADSIRHKFITDDLLANDKVTESAIHDKVLSIYDYFKDNVIKYYDKQGRIAFKYKDHNQYLQKRCDEFAKVNKFQHNGNVDDYLAIGNKLNNHQPNSISFFECNAFANANKKKSPLNDHDCQQLLKKQLTTETVTLKKHDTYKPLKPIMPDTGLNKILVGIRTHSGHCFYSCDNYLIDLIFTKKDWKGCKLSYDSFKKDQTQSN